MSRKGTKGWIWLEMLTLGLRIRIIVELEVVLMYSLAGLSKEEVMSMGEQFAINAGLTDHVAEFRKGALVAQNPKGLFYPFSL